MLAVHEINTWQDELSCVLQNPVELCEYLNLDAKHVDHIKAACNGFPLRIPRPYLSRIEKNNLQDPLLLQVLPQAEELISSPTYSDDPLEEADVTPLKGMLHKYSGRVLIILNGHCAIHCRYCFRRHFPYQEHRISQTDWQAITEYISKDASIHEVIFSGGDPLSCNDSTLEKRINDLARIEHVKTIRFHTRLPIMIPQRVTPELIEALTSTRLMCVMVMHCNHFQEIDDDVSAAFKRLHQAGITLLNQSVLLKNINDDVNTLAELSLKLFKNNTLPYYLHLLDPVQGSSSFNVDIDKAQEIQAQLRNTLPGYLVPRFAIETPKEKSKTLI